MKAIKRLISLGILPAVLLVGGVALANDNSVFDSVSSNSVLVAPKLTVAIAGTRVTLSWSKVVGAAKYKLHYAQYPFDGNPDSIKIGDVGDTQTISFDLLLGSTYLVGITACKDDNSDCSDPSNIQNVIIPLPTLKNSLGQDFKIIPAGTFTMGSPSNQPGRGVDEHQHQVTLTQPFYMQTTEVTQAQWEEVMGSNPSYFSGCPTCPVEQVSWDDVQLFISKMNLMGDGIYSLPTEVQWEYAARAGSTTAFASGGITSYSNMSECHQDVKLDVIGWYCYNSDAKTHPVAQKSPNAWGLYDMSGNVWEWCQDIYGSYTAGDVTDPTGLSSDNPQANRMERGGSWQTQANPCGSAYRLYDRPYERYSSFGFRLLRKSY